jgi:5'-nucleotidase
LHILVTNDDGIYAPGLAALEREMRALGSVDIVAPATEQSGVSHSITFLTPLICKEVFADSEHGSGGHRGWAVEGSPADCVKIGVFELCREKPDLIVSGINGGLNAGINVLYSGTVAAAIEGAFFGITSVAVSLEFDEHAQFDHAAIWAKQLIGQILERPESRGRLFNINIPTAALERGSADVCTVPMGVARYGQHFVKRQDPKGRTYYWATNDPPPEPTEHATDLTALAAGQITITPLCFDMTHRDLLSKMEQWKFRVEA